MFKKSNDCVSFVSLTIVVTGTIKYSKEIKHIFTNLWTKRKIRKIILFQNELLLILILIFGGFEIELNLDWELIFVVYISRQNVTREGGILCVS